jgi:hypothetical protein
MSVIVNLYSRQAADVFPDMRFVTFRLIDKVDPANVSIAQMNYNYARWNADQTRFSRELKVFLKEVGISYAWQNGGKVDYSSFVTIIIVNPTDYAYITLMSDEYEITTSHMLPSNMPSFMFHLTEEDYDVHKDAIYKAKDT